MARSPAHQAVSIESQVRAAAPVADVWTFGEVVYFVRDPDTGLIKIGHTCRIGLRLRQLNARRVRPLVVVATTPGARKLEGYLHAHLFDLRVSGEWFEPGPALCKIIGEIVVGCFDPASIPVAKNPIRSQSALQSWARRQRRGAAA
jgi:hypothetical protein